MDFYYFERILANVDLTQQIIAGVSAGIAILVQLNAVRYEGCAFRSLLVLLSILLDLTVVGLYFPFQFESDVFNSIKVSSPILVFAIANAAQSVLLWIYAVIKGYQVNTLLVESKIVPDRYMRGVFILQLFVRFLGLSALAACLFLAVHGKHVSSYISLSGLIAFVLGYFVWIYYLSQLRKFQIPLAVNRIFWASIGEILFALGMFGLYMAVLYKKIDQISGIQLNLEGDYAVALAFAVAYAAPISMAIYKLVRVTLVGYTIWDVLFLSKDEVVEEYEFGNYSAINGNTYI
jgi:hypothetical protein